MTDKKKPSDCLCKASGTLFKLRAATARVEKLADQAKEEIRDALTELMAENPDLMYLDAADIFKNLNEAAGCHAAYMLAHKACLPILDACNTEPPGSTERR